MTRTPDSPDQLHDLELLIRAHHPLVVIETVEEDRVSGLLQHLGDRLGMAVWHWTAHRGLMHSTGGSPVVGTEDPVKCLEHIGKSNLEALFHLRSFGPSLTNERAAALIRELHGQFYQHRGAIIVSGPEIPLASDLEPLFTAVDLESPSPEAYFSFINAILRDLKKRMDVKIEMSADDVAALLSQLRGLTFLEVRKIVTRAVVEDGKLSRDDLGRVLEAKKRIIERSGVLEYYPAEESMRDVAGLENLKDWLRKRRSAFSQPDKVKDFGLTPPKGLLLIGVQGCGKSLCAKAVASEWRLPLVRLDPSALYQKFFGESERNMRRAIKTAEAMAPIVMWIDEVEKAFGPSDDNDGGTSKRIFGAFLTWLQDKKESVFVIATANDISRLPPEFLRKGRFDEIFFVDLPDESARKQIFEVHLRRRQRKLTDEALTTLAQASDGFSGAELEQVVISSLYASFSSGDELGANLILREIAATRPLSVTMSEKITALREWAFDRAVPAGQTRD